MRTLVLLVATFLVMLIACGSPRADEGRDALMQVTNAQFYRGAMPPDGSGPKIVSATSTSRARAGDADQACDGELERTATAVAVGLVRDVGYWIVPAGVPSSSAPSSPTFQFAFGVSASLSEGVHEVMIRAVDGAGRFGPAIIRTIEIVAAQKPTGRLVVSLWWDNKADLDLHVVIPSGIEIFKRNPTEYERPPPSAGPVPPNAPTDGGVLDRDSNARCVFDGQRAENVVWTEAPPKGRYIVRVDTFSLCGAVSAQWRLEVRLDGVRVGTSQGTSTENDLRFEHNRGGGVLALEFDVP